MKDNINDVLSKLDDVKPTYYMPFTDEPLYSKAVIEAISRQHAREEIRKMYDNNIIKGRTKIDEILKDEVDSWLRLASELMGISVNEMKSGSRKKEVVFARFIFYSLARFFSDISMDKIAKAVNRDHSTISVTIKTHSSRRYGDGLRVEKIIKSRFDESFDIEEMYMKSQRTKDEFEFV